MQHVSASRSACTNIISPFLHGCIHLFHNLTCLAGFSTLLLESFLPLGQGGQS